MKITDEQLKQLRTSFALYDANGDGAIDAQEIHKVLLDLGVADPNSKEAEQILAELDANGDGSVSFGEFLKVVKSIDSLKEVEVDDIVAVFSKKHHKETVPDKTVEPAEVPVPHHHHEEEVALAAIPASHHKEHHVEEEESLPAEVPVSHHAEEHHHHAEEHHHPHHVEEPAPVSHHPHHVEEPAPSPAEVPVSHREEPVPTPAAVPSTVPSVPQGSHSSPHSFIWRYEGSYVELAGDFTSWGAGKLPLHHNKDGSWEIEITLSPGRYEYRFIIDHNVEWYYDILQPNVLNTGSGYINNVITV